ncbi:tannase/feruloyl esterase family alpha/beta hydrolase [Nocardioides yefusunii]|uniref:Tannase/feruloyl esterase family alpha/beta hydrolase n=1 Tax=Nocardioides yefusunii TaxID=2500546 RepID=A0ABW1QTE2_9ACTN|nr:tannase/feruloyl esterase family alpha/beta hydrolase [Nocardioides yefusunii]
MSRRWLAPLTSLTLALSGTFALSATSTAVATPATTTLSSDACVALLSHEDPSVSGARITSAEIITAAGTMPEHCRVTGTVTNKAGGLATFRVNLPTAGHDGRMYFRGCGGSCGSLIGPDPTWLARGHVVATTDMVTHSYGSLSFAWARNNREAEIDFSYRATHEATVIAKNLTKAAYGARPSHSYFYGGSTGGRQALVGAQRYPYDYDGIIALYPASNETSIGTLHLLWSAGANLDAQGEPIMTNADAEILHADVIAYCDPKDGLTDGLIEDPRACNFKASQSRLSPAKAAVAQLIYDGPRDSSGKALTPGGPELGSELNWRNNYIQADGAAESVYTSFGKSFTRDAAFEDDLPEDWTPDQFDWDTDPARLGFMEQFYTSTNTDLSTFHRAGGKLLLFQGWSDQSVVPAFTLDYHARLVAHMGKATTDEFLRFYTVPGLGHSALPLDPTLELHDWVENGKAPHAFVARNLTGATKAATRPLYPFPLVPRWSGKGNINDLATWRSFDPTARPIAPVRPAEPVAKAPGKVSKVKVNGKTRARTRTVSWRAPAAVKGAPVLRYRITVSQKGKVTSNRTIRSSVRSMKFSTSKLRSGRAKVTVRAVNNTGSSAPASVVFRIKK